MSGFKALKDRLTLLLAANALGDFKWKSGLIYTSGHLSTLQNYKLTLPEVYKQNNKAWMTAHLLTAWFTEYSKPTAET